ncbi:SemiSWEET transporter [Undibacterium sp. TJN19]|uniref:SemiSWEET transporter n=1 Tax=Undibacterium sp. TJN19 TaxID=3413055 RepID=UPI003BF1E317
MNFLLSADIVGYFAASMTTAAFVPQAWMTWQRKRAEGVSLGMYLILVVGILLWLIYGLMLHALPVIIANMITLVLASFILVMKLVYK